MDSSKGNCSRRETPPPRRRSRTSPNSIFPFGSPINSRSILNPGSLPAPEVAADSSNNVSASLTPSGGSHHVLRGRVRAEDLYGGPLVFGGRSSSAGPSASQSRTSSRAYGLYLNEDAGGKSGAKAHRRNRLLFSASPYHSAASARIMNHHHQRRDLSIPSTEPANANGGGSNGLSPSSCSSSGSLGAVAAPSADGISSTARLILDTLDKVSTPLNDAKKIPLNEGSSVVHNDTLSLLETPSRAERRKLIAEKLNITSGVFGDPSQGMASKRQRRRPNLGAILSEDSERLALKGPPLRSTAFSSPLPSRKYFPTTSAKPSLPAMPSNDISSAPESFASPARAATGVFSSSMSYPEQSLDGGGGKMRAKVSSVAAVSSIMRAQGSSAKSSGPTPAATSFPQPPAISLPPKPSRSVPLNVTSMPKISFAGATATVAASAVFQPSKAFGFGHQASSPPPVVSGAPSDALGRKEIGPTSKDHDQRQSPSSKPELRMRAFEFSSPEKVADVGTLTRTKNGLVSFAFSEPSKVGKISTSAGRTNESSVVLPDFLKHETAAVSAQIPVMSSSSLPGLSPVLHKKPVAKPAAEMVVGGSVMDVLSKANRKLPDVTSIGGAGSAFEPGIKPASELKNESVMSILGGNAFSAPTWDKKFKTNEHPW